jgi:hypothetical protein
LGFAVAKSLSARSGFSSDADGDTVQPGAELVWLSDQAGAAGEDEEDGLEGIFGRVVVVEQVPADPEDKPAVTGDQGREGGFGD